MSYRGSLTICDNGHDEVCYSTGECPVCVTKEEMQLGIDELEKEVADLHDQMVLLENKFIREDE
ncbi:MAG: hypothetical protein ACREBU_12070 [Nitrososphaera sp.]